MVSTAIQGLLALEVAVRRWPVGDPQRDPRPDPGDEPDKLVVGCATNPRRTAQARHRGRPIDRRQVHGQAPWTIQTWRTFLRNHADGIAAADLFVVPTIGFKLLYCLVILAHGRRKLVHHAVTAHPSAEWIARQIVEAFPWDTTPRYLVRDRDAVYGHVVKRQLRALGIRDPPTAPHSPWQNAYLVTDRTALINQLRALLLERGITAPQGRRKLERLLSEILAEEDNGLGSRMRRLIEDMRSEWRGLDERITAFDDELAERARADEATRRLVTIPGIGVLTATALVAAVGNARTFARGRDLAAWLGLAPRQATTGGKPRLLGISKRGNRYLRMLLIHGARTALPGLAQSDTPLGRWLKGLLERTHRNVATVALANKLARIAWAVLAHDRRFVALHIGG